MAYGMFSDDTDGRYIIDSRNASTEHMGIVASGISTINSPITTQANDLIFARPYDSLSTTANRFVLFNRNSTDTNITFYQSRVSYFILRKTSAISQNVSGQTHGVQLFDSADPPKLIYDSRKAVSGVKVLGSHGVGSFGGGATNGIPDANGNGYPGAGGGNVSGSRSNVITTSNVSTTYMSCNYGYVLSGNMSATNLYQTASYLLFGYYYTTSNIQWLCTFDLNILGSTFEVGMSNFETIIRGQLI